MLAAYISFDGTSEEAFNFYKNALNGTITDIQRFGDSPVGSENLSEADKNKIMHIALKTPDGVQLMGNDHMEFMGGPLQVGNNFSMSLHPSSQAVADDLFNSLSAGGSVTVPMSKAPWGDYFGMLTDKFGIKWMINHAAQH